MDGFEQREMLGKAYWKDPRWKLIDALRNCAYQLHKRNLIIESERLIDESNGILCEIHRAWGID